MKYFFTLCVALLFFTISYSQEYKRLIKEGTHTIESISQSAEDYFDTAGRGRGTGYKQYRRWLYFAERMMDETGKLKTPSFYHDELVRYNGQQIDEETKAPGSIVGSWEDLGPTYWNATSGYNPGVGRITSIAIEENNLDHIIAGSQTGGVWKSLDGGNTWQVLSDNLGNMDVYSLAIDPVDSSVYYWGSSGGTIFKSTDAGATWNLHSNLPSGFVNKILIDPTNTSKMYASVEWGGLFKSVDGGNNWSLIHSGATTGYDFEFKPDNPSVIYASGNNFYKSTNGGLTFTAISGSNQFSNGPKMIGVSLDNPFIVYVIESNQGVFGGFHKSIDVGESFTKLDHNNINYFGYDTFGQDNLGQAPRDMDIVVNPENVNDVHIAGINSWRSTDGGVSFDITSQWVVWNAASLNIGYCHADVDIMLFAQEGDSENPTTKLFLGTDGGIFRADNPLVVNADYYTDITTGMSIRQFYKLGISQTDPVVMTGGSQDNGSSRLGADGNWTDWWGADGMEGFVDKDNTQIMYGTTQFGNFVKTFNGGLTINGVTQPDGKGGNFNWNWVVPYEQDPAISNRIYAAFDEVYQSENGGDSWTSISQNFNANIDHFKVAFSDNSKKYLAIDGNFYFSSSNNTNWTQTSLNLNGSRINEIAVHPTNPNKVAIATTDSGKVYVSDNSGLSFTAIGWDLPNFVPLSLVWQDNEANGLYVGMNYGVYYTDEELGETWEPFNNGLPNVRVNELEINTAENKLYAATYGRGLWKTELYNSTLSTTDLSFEDFIIFPNPARNVINLSWNNSEVQSVRIFDSKGKLVYYAEDLIIDSTLQIETSNFSKGLYFVKFSSTSGEVTKKVILE